MTRFFTFVRRVATRSRTVVGVALIIASVVGVVLVVRAAAPGDRVVLASSFLPAGTVISHDVVREALSSSHTVHTDLSLDDVVGKVLGVDVGEGEVVSTRMFEPALVDRIVVSVPLGVSPPPSVGSGTNVSIWAVDSGGLVPPRTVATNALVESLTESGFGGDTIVTLRVVVTDVDRLLAVLGTGSMLVMTSGETP